YKTVETQTFDFEKEMYKYCKSDVDILRRGCLELRKLFIEISDIDPFQYITIASVCQAIYRHEFLPANTIGRVDETPVETYSIKAIKWLTYLSRSNNIDIKHACNGGEFSVTSQNGKKYKVDGYHDESQTVYQFHGCYFHGCSKCYDEFTINEKNGIRMG